MQVESISYSDTRLFPGIFLDYISNSEKLHKFYNYFPKVENVESLIRDKEFDQEKRGILAEVLTVQYQGLTLYDELKTNIEKLKDPKTFTVTTGHQLNICTGPLYFNYKIVSTINACKKLKECYPSHDFVPVYWMAGEDHDFAEINHFNLFGKKYEWASEQTGPVGKFDPSGILEVLGQLPEKVKLFEDAYTKFGTLCEATRYYVNELFGAEGLVVLDADHEKLKRSFIPVIKDDLLNHQANRIVEEDSAKLDKLDYKTQVFPRTINFFYMENGVRERIVLEDGVYKVLNQDLSFTKDEILGLVEEHPEKFSPNVILRPLYQEIILPNLVYIGGPGELAYWLQLKGVFDHYETQFPMLVPRNHAVVINKGNQKKLNKLEISPSLLFQDFNEIKEDFLKSKDAKEVDLGPHKSKISDVFDEFGKLAAEIDQSLQGFIAAEGQKTQKSIDSIEKRLRKSEESKLDTSIQQIRGLLERLFPGGAPQERVENFLNFYINNPEFIRVLLDNFEPFDLRYSIFIDD